ncbi:head GIN domain-containing protein [Bacteroidota bacterium]
MKTLYINIIAIAVAGILFLSCEESRICVRGEGTITTKTLSISDFTGVDLTEAANVVIAQGSSQEVSVTGHPNIIDRLSTNVSGNTWAIDLEKGCYDGYELTVNITVPDINDITLSGTGNITINDFTNQEDLFLSIPGAGDINLNSFTGSENLSINVSGVGTISANGEFPDLKRLNLKFSGSGNYHGYPIASDACEINIPGTGNCYVYVREILDIKIGGSGSIYYKGNPTITKDISGSGNVIDDN